MIPDAAVTDRGYSRMRWTGQIFWLLAYDACAAPHLLPAFTVFCGGSRVSCTTKESQAARLPLQRLAQWEVVSSYSSATAPDSHGISCADPLFQARKELPPELAACALRFKNYLITCQLLLSCRVSWGVSVKRWTPASDTDALQFARDDKIVI